MGFLLNLVIDHIIMAVISGEPTKRISFMVSILCAGDFSFLKVLESMGSLEEVGETATFAD
jgi:hypothetical protein